MSIGLDDIQAMWQRFGMGGSSGNSSSSSSGSGSGGAYTYNSAALPAAPRIPAYSAPAAPTIGSFTGPTAPTLPGFTAPTFNPVNISSAENQAAVAGLSAGQLAALQVPGSISSAASQLGQGASIPGINDIQLPSWLQGGADANMGELLSAYSGIGAAFDPTGQVNARNAAAQYNLSSGGQTANNAATEYANRATQAGGNALGAGVVKAQSMMPVLSQNAQLKTDAADVAAKAHQDAAGLAAQIGNTIGNLRQSYLQTLTGYATGQQQMQLDKYKTDQASAGQAAQLQQGYQTAQANAISQAQQLNQQTQLANNQTALGYGQLGASVYGDQLNAANSQFNTQANLALGAYNTQTNAATNLYGTQSQNALGAYNTGVNAATNIYGTQTNAALQQQQLAQQSSQFQQTLQQQQSSAAQQNALSQQQSSNQGNSLSLQAALASLQQKAPTGSYMTNNMGQVTSGNDTYNQLRNWQANQTQARSALQGLI